MSGLVPDDMYWRDGLQTPGIQGYVFSLQVFGTELYAAGSFVRAGDLPVENVASWNGSSWRAVGGGISGTVFAMTVFEGRLVAGGEFLEAGGNPALKVAAWNGSRWEALGPGPGFDVLALAVIGDTLVAAGVADHVARWDGSAWAPLGDEFDGGPETLAVYGGELVAGGGFTQVGGVPCAHVAAWDGVRWHPLGAGLDADVDVLVEHNGTLIATGPFLASGSLPVREVARWNGAAWRPMGDGLEFSGMAAVSDGVHLFVSGTVPGDRPGGLAEWDGSSWSPVGAGTIYPIRAMAFFEGLLCCGGNLVAAGDLAVQSVAAWDGTRWLPLDRPGLGLSQQALALTEFGTDLIVGGWFTHAGRLRVNHVARWTGSGWAAFGSGVETPVRALEVYRGQLWAAGLGGPARWDGAQWSTLVPNFRGDAYSLQVFGDRLVVGGAFDTLGDVPCRNVASWDGERWEPLAEGLDGTVWDLKIHDGALVALFIGGYAHGVPRPDGIWRWDGIAWQDLGLPPHFLIAALAVYRGDLYAGGTSIAIGQSGVGLVRWTGTGWDSVPGADCVVQALGVHQDRLIVSGSIFPNGGDSVLTLARWDGSTWSPLGSGVERQVNALFSHDSRLYAAGDFHLAGGKRSTYFAEWSGPALAVSTTAEIVLGPLLPNPFSERAHVGFTLRHRSHVRLEVFDLQGRRRATLVDAALEAGPHLAEWNGADDGGQTSDAGLYLVRLETPAGSKTIKLVRVR